MAVSFIAASAVTSTGFGTGVTPVIPSSNVGDLFVAVCALYSNAVVGTPTGWTSITQVNQSTGFRAAFFAALQTGSLANPAFTWSPGAQAGAIIYQFRGSIQTGSPPAWGASSNANGTTNPHTSPSITSTAPGSLAIAIDVQESNVAQGTTPAGWNADSAVGDATSAIAWALWDKTLGNTGSTTGAISVTEAAVGWVQLQGELLADILQAQACI